MNEVQLGLYEMLKEIDSICRENDIDYYLGGGTALGAVRHRGFLPWDDDADLYITRDNWKKLLAVIDKVMPSGRELVCNERYDKYRNPIPRYMNLNTTWIYQSQMFAGTPLGQHIEFLILDPMPSETEKYQEYLELFAVYAELLSPYFVVNRNTSSPSSVFNESLYKRYLKRAKKIGENTVLSELEDALFSYPEESCTDYHLRHGVEIKIYHKPYFGKPRYVPYEETMLPVAERAESVFRQAYGDSWKKVPPPQEQVVHNSVHTLLIPYTEFTSRYYESVDLQDAWDCNYEHKVTAANRLTLKDRVNAEIGTFREFFDNELASYLFSGDRCEYDSEDYEKFFSVQVSSSAFNKNRLLNVPQAFVSKAVYYFIQMGAYWKANKLFSLYNDVQKNSIDGSLQCGLIEESRAIDILLDTGCVEQAYEIACGSRFEATLSPFYFHAKLAYGEQAGLMDEAVLAVAREAFPCYSYFAFLDAKSKEGTLPDKSKVLYAAIIDSSDDGMVILAAKDRLENLKERF